MSALFLYNLTHCRPVIGIEKQRINHIIDATNATNNLDMQQIRLINLPEGFDGKLTSSKWVKIAKCSKDSL
jgi:hypothetical protein